MNNINRCVLFKASGCDKVDSLECNYDMCRDRLLYEIFRDEVILNIPVQARLYSICPEYYVPNISINNYKCPESN